MLNWATANGTAQYHLDYIPWSDTVTFAPGETQASATVTLMGDTIAEPVEYFTVDLSYVRDAIPVNLTGTGYILDNDGPAPTLKGTWATASPGGGRWPHWAEARRATCTCFTGRRTPPSR